MKGALPRTTLSIFVLVALAACSHPPVRYNDSAGVTNPRPAQSKPFDSQAEKHYQHGVDAFAAGNTNVALDAWLSAARMGHSQAQSNVGYLLAQQRQFADAVNWLRQAAENGNADAQNNLGYLYAKGRGVQRNMEEAIKWYLKAAAQEHKGAQSNLAAINTRVTPVPTTDKDVSSVILSKATRGEAVYQFLMGLRFFSGQGVARDHQQAVAWLEKAAQQNYPAAQYQLGYIYAKTSSGEHRSKAYYWMQRAANNQHTAALAWLAKNER